MSYLDSYHTDERSSVRGTELRAADDCHFGQKGAYIVTPEIQLSGTPLRSVRKKPDFNFAYYIILNRITDIVLSGENRGASGRFSENYTKKIK